MNIKHFLSAAAALTMLAACSDYDPGESANAIDLTDAEIETIEEYNANFIARYGTPAEGHTWGFGAKGSEDEMGTRAVQVDRPNWTILVDEEGKVRVKGTVGTDHELEGDNGSYHIYTYGEKAGYTVPGFPSAVDGIYYFEKDSQQQAWTQHQIEDWEDEQQALNDYEKEHGRAAGLQPVGDVTDEEIQYVSWYFRNTYRPQSVTPPFTEFFMQNISKDLDRVITYDDNDVPVSAHGEHINNGKIPKMDSNSPTGNIVKNDQGDILYDNSSYSMDHLIVYTTEAAPEHLNNFNAGNTNPIKEGPAITDPYQKPVPVYPNRELKYWETNGGYTTSFSYQCPSDVDSKTYTDYVLVHLEFDIPQGDGSSHHYDGYYLAFDYEMHKQNTDGTWSNIFPDGFYSNWIVKLSPGNPQWSDHQWYRIMCEDLGSTDDFDFNDLVYDVYFTGTNDQYIAHIKVQAAGGTLPIYVGTHTEKSDHEAHQILQGGNARKLNDKLYQPVNVAAGVTADPVEITFEMKDSQGNWLTGDAGTDPDNIPILVTSLDNSRKIASGKNTFVLKTAGTSPTPQKICIPGNTVRWMKERQQIETSYTNFDKWVTSDEDSDYDFGKSQDWTTHGVNTGNLY